MITENAPEVSEDALLGGRVRLRQPIRGHRAGTDAVLLAGLAAIRPGERVVDLGSASGAVGLMIASLCPDVRVVLVERDPALVALARENIALNRLGGRVQALEADVFDLAADRRSGSIGAADAVVTNPPFFEKDEQATRPSPDPSRRRSHAMAGGVLTQWIEAAGRVLRPRGRLWLVHRADRTTACLDGLRSRFGSVEVTPVYPREGESASRIVVAATYGGRGPFRLAQPLILHGPDGRFTPRAAALHAGRGDA